MYHPYQQQQSTRHQHHHHHHYTHTHSTVRPPAAAPAAPTSLTAASHRTSRSLQYPDLQCSSCRLSIRHLLRVVTKPRLCRCAGCKAVYYCSKVCQERDWKNHRILCRQIRMQERMKLKFTQIPAPGAVIGKEEVQRPPTIATTFAEPHPSATAPAATATALHNDADDRKPRAGQMIQFHYTGKLSNGQVFDSSRRSRNYHPFGCILGIGQLIEGLELAIMSMQVGESASFLVAASAAYGDNGATVKIPPKCPLIYDVHVVSAKAPDAAELRQLRLIHTMEEHYYSETSEDESDSDGDEMMDEQIESSPEQTTQVSAAAAASTAIDLPSNNSSPEFQATLHTSSTSARPSSRNEQQLIDSDSAADQRRHNIPLTPNSIQQRMPSTAVFSFMHHSQASTTSTSALHTAEPALSGTR